MSVDSGEVEGNLESRLATISADGRYVVFESRADNLVPPDTNTAYDVFVRDRWLGTTEQVSVSSAGVPANSNQSGGASITPDGRYVAFYSGATNLVSGDTNSTDDVFVRDLQLGTTERVSIDSAGVEGNNYSGFHPSFAGFPQISITPDGRYVAFYSNASNLVPGDTNGLWDIFVRDRQFGTTERVNVSSTGAQADGFYGSQSPRISPDGRYVVFASDATNIGGGHTNSNWDIFLRDRQLGTTEIVSVSTIGGEAGGASYVPSVSSDGRYVCFFSGASNLVTTGDTNGTYDVFVRDRQLGTTELVSVDSGGVVGNGQSGFHDGPSMTADGRYVAFNSLATNLVAGDTNAIWDVFVRDRLLGTTVRVSVDSSGVQGNNSSETPSLSPDGRYVVFHSDASNLVPGDTNARLDVFVHDRDATSFTSLCDPGVGGVITCPCSNPPAGSGRGCDNFGAGPVDSGTLTASGVAYLGMDTVVLTASGENNTSLSVFWGGQASVPGGAPSGAGVRCVQTNLRRYYLGSASSGSIARPGMGDPSLSTRAAALGVPISAGQTRYYYVAYRDPGAAAPCGNSSSTINLTNAGAILWNL